MTAITWNALSQRYMSLSGPHAHLSRAHPRKHPLDVRDGSLRQDSVPQIEDEGSFGKDLERQIDGAVECSATDEQHEGVEISLHRQARLELLAREGGIDRPIKTDGIHSNILHIGQERGAGPARESDDLCAGNLRPHCARMRRVGSMHHRRSCSAGKMPAQVSKICTASTPASNCRS